MRVLVIPMGVLCVLLVWYIATTLMRSRRQVTAGWRVEPRSLPDGTRQAWLTCPGYRDQLHGSVTAEDGRVDPTEWDRVLYDAEAQAMEYDRLRLGR